jgi:hypothetical protein
MNGKIQREVRIVKKQVLNFGITATHDLITPLDNFADPRSISDFDAFAIDVAALSGGVTQDAFIRRRNEIRDLLTLKGGLVVSLLRHNIPLGFPGMVTDIYGLFDLVALGAMNLIRASVRAGTGVQIKVVASMIGPSAGYFRVLKGALRFASYLATDDASIVNSNGAVFAVDSVAHPIAVEFLVGAGRLCFLPVPQAVDGKRVGAAIMQIVETHFGGLSDVEAPAWAVDVMIPGSNAHDGRIAQLERERAQIETEIAALKEKRDDLNNFRVLLYGYGKSLLEPVVRSAFRVLGFLVPEPEEYAGEWDVELRQGQSPVTAIAEIEGSVGVIDVDKYRQLLDYVEQEALDGREHKGILVGNGFRLTAPEELQRQSQFSDHALRGAKRNGFGLLATSELFKAVCAVLEAADNEALKIRVRESILSAVGVWTFAREA